jgi:hypothetical protein
MTVKDSTDLSDGAMVAALMQMTQGDLPRLGITDLFERPIFVVPGSIREAPGV